MLKVTSDANLNFRIPAEEREAIAVAAKRDGKTVAVWMRDLAKRRIVEQEKGIEFEGDYTSDGEKTLATALAQTLVKVIDEAVDRRIKAAK